MSFKKLATTLLLLSAGSFIFLSSAFTSPQAIQCNQHPGSLDTLPNKDTMIGDKIFSAVDEEDFFSGGDAGWRSYLEKNLNPMIPINNGAPAGMYTVMIQFVVDTRGKLSAIEALTKHGYGMEQEVMRILRKSPPWVPAVLDGNKVNAYRKQPVTFQVIEEKKKKKNRS